MPFPGLWSWASCPGHLLASVRIHSCPPLSPVDASRLSSYHLLPKCVLCIVSNHTSSGQQFCLGTAAQRHLQKRLKKSRPPGHPLRAQGREQHKGLDTARAAGWSYPCALNARTTQENRKHAPEQTHASAAALLTTATRGSSPKPINGDWIKHGPSVIHQTII